MIALVGYYHVIKWNFHHLRIRRGCLRESQTFAAIEQLQDCFSLTSVVIRLHHRTKGHDQQRQTRVLSKTGMDHHQFYHYNDQYNSIKYMTYSLPSFLLPSMKSLKHRMKPG